MKTADRFDAELQPISGSCIVRRRLRTQGRSLKTLSRIRTHNEFDNRILTNEIVLNEVIVPKDPAPPTPSEF